MSSLRVPVTDQDHALGNGAAPVTLVEYGDYQCPFCGEAYPIVKELLAKFGDQVRFVFRNFPLAEIHPEAVNAANLAEFAAEHGQFWRTHDLLFENQRTLGPGLYERLASRLELSAADALSAITTNRYGDRIFSDEQGGLRSGVNGTPTFFLNGRRVDGGTPSLEESIRELLA